MKTDEPPLESSRYRVPRAESPAIWVMLLGGIECEEGDLNPNTMTVTARIFVGRVPWGPLVSRRAVPDGTVPNPRQGVA